MVTSTFMFESVVVDQDGLRPTPRTLPIEEKSSRTLIVQRRFPHCSFLMTTSVAPAEAYSALERFLSESNRSFVERASVLDGSGRTPASRQPLRFRLHVKPQDALEVKGRFVPSAGGSNVYVRVAFSESRPFMTVCLFVLLLAALTHSLILDEITVTDGLALLAVAASAVTVNIKASKVAGLLAAALPDKRVVRARSLDQMVARD